MNKQKTNRPDIYTRITNQVIESLERGVKSWTQPWSATHEPGNRACRDP